MSRSMRILTWNVNSLRTRLGRLFSVLERHAPDVACLQELKVEDEEFPALEIRGAGYHASFAGQRAYNGVAVLTRMPHAHVTRSFRDGVDDPQARFIACEAGGVRVLNVYVPNGGEVGTEKWLYKLEWLGRLRRYLEREEDPERPLALCGDFNVAPDDRDVRNPERWAESVLCHPEGRAALARVVDWGLVDAFRVKHPEGGIYSWWDYRMLGFAKNDGLRIDGIYVTPALAGRLLEARVDRDERKGKKPSDHAPLVCDFS
jgi:exodeoxyribonuclease-3